jgi:hypothetical protein
MHHVLRSKIGGRDGVCLNMVIHLHSGKDALEIVIELALPMCIYLSQFPPILTLVSLL